jgi:uncharacterized protein YigE (DUF2233 family)
MKKYVFTIITVSSIVLLFFLFQNVSTKENNVLPAQSKHNDETIFKEKIIKYEDYLYSYEFILVNNIDKVSLVLNYEHKMSSDEAVEDNSCKYLTSAGFYSKDGNPIGLLINDHITINDYEINQLFNGFLTINSFDTPIISYEEPKEGSRISVQSGPVLIENSFIQELTIKNDKDAGRIIAAVSGSNDLIFIVVYDQESHFSGPKLSDLPNITKAISDDNELNIADAINLDGGTASVFFKDQFTLKELSNVGSFFCVRD